MDEVTPKVRPIHLENKDPRPVAHLYKPDDPSEPKNLLDSLALHCGIQWGMKRPVAQAIVDHYRESENILLQPVSIPNEYPDLVGPFESPLMLTEETSSPAEPESGETK